MAKTTFTDGSLLDKIPGTRVLAAWLNKVFNHRHDGADQDGSAPLDYAADTSGAADALVIALTPALTANVTGMPIWLKVAHTNTGATTLKINGLAAVAVHKNNGQALVAGDLHAGQIIGVAWDGAAYQLISYQIQLLNDADTLNGQTAAQLMPPGAIVPFGAPTVPSGWLHCNGQAVSRVTYAALFASVGTIWGAGDNITTFNLPDLRGEFLRGWDNGRGIDAARAFATEQADMLKSHQHTLSGGGGSESGSYADTTSERPDVTVSTDATGGTETRPRNIAVLYCIKY